MSSTSPTLSWQFHAISLTVAVVAGLATYGTTSVMLSPPAMFLGWVAFNLAGTSLSGGLANLGSFLLGLVFGAGTALAITALTPALGVLAAPLAVAGVVVLVLSLRSLSPCNNPLAYFLGLTSFFYSGLASSGDSLVMLGAAGVIGGGACAVATLAQAAVSQMGGARQA